MFRKKVKSDDISNTKPTKLLTISEMKHLNDADVRRKAFEDLVRHVLANKCVECHDVSALIHELTQNLVCFLSCDQSILTLIEHFNWFDSTDESLSANFCRLISDYVNVKPFKCAHILKTVIVPRFNGLSRFDGESTVTSDEMNAFNRLHAILRQMKASKLESILLKTVDRLFPFRYTCSVHSHVCFISNMLTIYEYVSNRDEVLALVIDKILWIDLMCTPEKMSRDQEVFAIEDCESSAELSVAKLVALLDRSVEAIIDFIDKIISTENCDQISKLVQSLHIVFSDIIINTEGCYHLQYIIFYFYSKSESRFDDFIQMMWKMAINTELTLAKRERTIYYIRSFIINAKYASLNTALLFMDTATLWIHMFIDNNDLLREEFNSEDSIFYVLCEALFDIFCSFHVDFDDSNIRCLKAMDFQRIIKSKLSPLQFCDHDIAVKFTCLARHYQIAYCAQSFNKKEDKKRFPKNHLSSFTAFGPYLLPNTSSKIECIYRHFACDENKTNEREKYLSYSDDSDYAMHSFKQKQSPSATLWQNLLTDSSPNTNEHMDWGSY